MFGHGQIIKQNVVLRADSEAFSNQIDIFSDVVPVNDGSTRCWGEQTGQYRHCSSFSSAIMAEKWRNLSLVQVETQSVYRNFVAIFVNLA